MGEKKGKKKKEKEKGGWKVETVIDCDVSNRMKRRSERVKGDKMVGGKATVFGGKRQKERERREVKIERSRGGRKSRFQSTASE